MGDSDWRATGLDEHEIRNAAGLGLTVPEVVEWSPFRPLEIYWAKKHGLSLQQARRWAAEGVPVRDAVQAIQVGLTVDEVHAWEAHGLNASDAWEATETGVTIPEALAWREAGFVIPDALQLIRDRWTLADAVIARNDGIDRYGDGHRLRS